MRARPPLALGLFALTVALAPEVLAAAGAEGGGEHGLDWWTFGKHTLNLVIFVSVLAYLLRKPLNEYMATRSKEIRDQIEASQRALEAAQAEIGELRGQLAGLEGERAATIQEAAAAAEGEKERAIERAREAAERVRNEARRVADQEVERARLTLQAEAAALATQLAGEILRERLGEDDDRRLVDEFTQEIGGGS